VARQRTATRSLVAAGAVAVVAVGGLVLPRLVSDRSTADREATVAEPAAAVHPEPADTPAGPEDDDAAVGRDARVAAPSSSAWGVPVGYPQSAAGVRAAAVAWVASLGDLLRMGPIARNDALGALLTERAFADTVEQLRVDRDRFTDQFKRDLSEMVWVDAAVSVTIVSAEATRAVVEVWSVLLFGATEARVESLWRTHTVTLLWVDGSWRVDDVSHRDGPTPVNATTAMPSAGSDFAGVVGWTPAVLAGISVG
jgi:hypothetical protein